MTPPIQLSDDLRAALLSPDNLPPSILVNAKEYIPEAPVDAGFKGAVWRVRDEFGRPRALKLCIHEDYHNRSYLQELVRASDLEPYPEFAHFVDAGLTKLDLAGFPTQTFVGFIEEWIEGLTLKAFLQKQQDRVAGSFLLAYVRQICSALNALKAVDLRHDDLHAANVMLSRPAPGSLSDEWKVKIVDTGSIKPARAPLTKPKDDHRHFVEHLVGIWNAVHLRRPVARVDRRFLAETSRLLRSMLDEDPSVALREPAQIRSQFEASYTRANASLPDSALVPTSPFEFISAEHIADDRLLVSMFASSCPFLDKINGPDPCLVTGPRGCGKSTIFRWLSLKAHLHKSADEIDTLRVAGFYVSCTSDLQNRLSWIRTDTLAKRFEKEIVHFFNLVLAREVVHTLSLISQRDDRERYWGFGHSQERQIHRFIMDAVSSSAIPRVEGVPRLVQAVEALEHALFTTHARLLRDSHAANCTGASFLGDLTTLLSRPDGFFRRKHIVFLVDDFSTHRLPEPVQVVLNQVIWERRASHVFKLSSEKYGATFTDALHATVDVAREMIEVDCGREYVALDDADQVERAKLFAIELLDNRLKAAGYKGDAKALIGPSDWPEGSLGRALVEKPGGRDQSQYHGLDCIAAVCSGDVSTLLLVYRHIFERGGVTPQSLERVPKHVQHDAIVSTSRELFEAIRRHFPYGPEMHAVVAHFGALVRNILQHGRPQKKGGTTTPSQCPRIELDQRHGSVVDDLASEQRALATELVRRAIFIEMEPGLSRHGHVTTVRWHFRRVFLPAFSAALAKNNAIKQPMDWFKFLLTDPQGACDIVWRRWPRKGGDGAVPELFADL